MICASCCGSKRQVDIACPPDCTYLEGAHGAAWSGRETERRRDLRRVAGFAQGLPPGQAELFFFVLVKLQELRARHGDLHDQLLGSAVGALRKTVETRVRGVLYEHHPEDARAEGILVDLRKLLESPDKPRRDAPPADSELLPVLAALEQSIAAAVREAQGSTTFLDSATRLVARLGQPIAAPERSPSLIVEP